VGKTSWPAARRNIIALLRMNKAFEKWYLGSVGRIYRAIIGRHVPLPLLGVCRLQVQFLRENLNFVRTIVHIRLYTSGTAVLVMFATLH
jgi:hypothetical protein